MPFYLEHSDEFGNMGRSGAHRNSGPTQTNHVQNFYREYCWVIEGALDKENMIQLVSPSSLTEECRAVYLPYFFETEGPSRIISLKEYVLLRNAWFARHQKKYTWDESVEKMIKELEEDDALRVRIRAMLPGVSFKKVMSEEQLTKYLEEIDARSYEIDRQFGLYVGTTRSLLKKR